MKKNFLSLALIFRFFFFDKPLRWWGFRSDLYPSINQIKVKHIRKGTHINQNSQEKEKKANKQKIQVNKTNIRSNMWDLKSIQMKNAKQINWKVFGTEKSLIHLMSMGLVSHEACRRCSFSKDISNNDRRARRQCLDSAKEISKILLYGAMRNSPRNHSGRIRFYLNSIKT